MLKRNLGGNLITESIRNLSGLDLRETMRTVLRGLYRLTLGLRETASAYRLATYRQAYGLMNTTNTIIQPPHSFTTMVYSMVIMFLAVTMVLLCQLSIMAILLLKKWPVLLLLVIAINSTIIIKLMLVLHRLMVSLWAVTKVKTRLGLDKPIKSGVEGLQSKGT